MILIKIHLKFFSLKKQNQISRLKAKARITGNYDDHINIREGISSLMIRLSDKNNLEE